MRFSAILGGLIAAALTGVGWQRHAAEPQVLDLGQDAYSPIRLFPVRTGLALGRSRSPGGRAHKRWKRNRAAGRA